MNSKLHILFIILLFASACKKQSDTLPQANEADPVFYLKGIFRGNPLLVQAGVNNVYMNTYDTVLPAPGNFFNSRFTGEFGKPEGRKLPGNFLFIVNDFKPSSSNLVNYFDSVVSNGNVLQFTRPGSPASGKLLIDYYSPNGTLYTTESDKQPVNSRFTILSVEEYQTNNAGKKTKKIKAVFNCKLYNQILNDSITFMGGEVVFALSRP